MNEKERKYFDMAKFVANNFSKDESTKVGCLILDPETYQVLSTGYNGFPRKVEETEERKVRPEKYFWVEHAERNAIYAAAKHGIKLDGATAYCTLFPCAECARAMIQAGIKKIIAAPADHPNFKESFERSKQMLAEAGVEVVIA
jgi:dCMP deaminase